MVFSSLIFVYAFLPLCLVLYLLVRKPLIRNYILIAFSLVFYAWGEPVYVFLMLATVAANHLFAQLISRLNDRKAYRRAALIVALIIDLGLLALFKYSGMIVITINQLSGAAIPVPELALPIGISFYTFQVITYMLDVYRNKVPVQKRFSLLLLYVSMFPQLVAGPIVRYGDIADKLNSRDIDYRLFASGVSRFIVGLAKKAILANAAGKMAAELMNASGFAGLSLLGAWLGIITYALQIYFDFSAYSDMAIGMGRMLGFRFKENFNYPYIARSATEFWRRWHISLGSFFREYVYIPLGGNRKAVYRNLLITWALTGLWHGASWNFVIWGLFWFALIALEKGVAHSLIAKIPPALSHIYLLLLMLLGWVIFYYTDLTEAGQFYLALFGGAKGGLIDTSSALVLQNNIFFLVLAAVGCLPISRWFKRLLASISARGKLWTVAVFVGRHLVLLVLLLFSTAMLVGNSYNPFIYFRF
jgi:alginate O-acetyltransferase complex protein AlgI